MMSVMVSVRIDESTLEQIDALSSSWSQTFGDKVSRSEMIRSLISTGLGLGYNILPGDSVDIHTGAAALSSTTGVSEWHLLGEKSPDAGDVVFVRAAGASRMMQFVRHDQVKFPGGVVEPVAVFKSPGGGPETEMVFTHPVTWAAPECA